MAFEKDKPISKVTATDKEIVIKKENNMPIQVLIIVVLILVVSYLIYRLNLASKERAVVLILDANNNTSWKIFDSMVEAKAYVKTSSLKNCIGSIIRTTDVDKHISNGH